MRTLRFFRTTMSLFVLVSCLIFRSAWAWDIVFDPSVFGKVADELLTLQQQASDISNALQKLDKKGDYYDWSSVQNQINQLGSIISQANGLAYNTQDMDAQFRKTYPGYQAPQNFNQAYQAIVEKTQNTLNGVLQSVGSNAQDFENEQSRLNFLQQRIQNAAGQTQAIQAASQIAAEQVKQMELLRQTVTAQTNAQTAYYAAQMQKDADGQAAFKKIVDNSNKTVLPFVK